MTKKECIYFRCTPFFCFNTLTKGLWNNQEQLTEFKIQLALPAPNIEVAQEVANKAQVLINQFGYYQFLKLVDFMQKNPGAVSFGLNLINRK